MYAICFENFLDRLTEINFESLCVYSEVELIPSRLPSKIICFRSCTLAKKYNAVDNLFHYIIIIHGNGVKYLLLFVNESI